MMYAALLRGVNVGGKNILPMKSLAAMFESCGCKNVKTYIQSGNIVFEADKKTIAKLSSVICEKIAEDFGFQTHIVLRSRDELAKIIAAVPYPDVELAHVVFLASAPTAAQIAQLDKNRSVPDQFHVTGSEIYLHLPNGMGKTKLTSAFFDSKLKTIGTARNWRTVLKLLEMMSE